MSAGSCQEGSKATEGRSQALQAFPGVPFRAYQHRPPTPTQVLKDLRFLGLWQGLPSSSRVPNSRPALPSGLSTFLHSLELGWLPRP